MKEILSGNVAAAYGAKLAKPDVISAYPITPQTPVVEKLSEFISEGELDSRYLKVESEHSVMSTCIGASIGGARTFTATSSQGLALMQEMLFWAANGRCPIVMANVNRGMAPPWSMWSDHTDFIAQSSTGWVQLFCHTNQEILDTIIQAYRIAEDERVMLPVMVSYDAFDLSHMSEEVKIPEEEKVEDFLSSFDFSPIDLDEPKLLWGAAFPEDALGFRQDMVDSMNNVIGVIEEVRKEFQTRFGRGTGLIETYECESAETVLVTIGSLSGTARVAVDWLNDEEYSVGLARIKSFNPFPVAELREVLREKELVLTFDRGLSFNRGAIYSGVRDLLYGVEEPPTVYGYYAGVAGTSVSREEFAESVKNSVEDLRKGFKEGMRWIAGGD
ncbi:hypothetical protein AKJ37_04125 [candidate division MSBL1 archaeon SCGC-AAA259I09]|uniref:Pyruvate ferredoxin oxidoreductase n=1 Tax=candidate division MSBL1 archaeon SCGC-AAA259I09 TaxID=1698267 RepID=A0A133US09_9EURY|nr:hypothetical protein AKJ37_04125 [candidate division MSBL1 archaeon SCGC-AAA259I09]